MPAAPDWLRITYNGRNYTDGDTVSLLDASELAELTCEVSRVRPAAQFAWSVSGAAVGLRVRDPATHRENDQDSRLTDSSATIAVNITTLADNRVTVTCAVSTALNCSNDTDAEISVQLHISESKWRAPRLKGVFPP